MAYLNLLRTIHLPLTSDGSSIKNSFGVVIAQASDPITATAIVELVNLGREKAEIQNASYEASENNKAKLFGQNLKVK